MDIYTTRARNLSALIAQMADRGVKLRKDQQQALGGLGSSYLSQLVKGKKIGDATARKIEEATGRPVGWMDNAHGHNTGHAATTAPDNLISLLPMATPRSKARLTIYREKIERGEALTREDQEDLVRILKKLEAVNAASQ